MEGEGRWEAPVAISNSSLILRRHKHKYKLYSILIGVHTYLLLKTIDNLVLIEFKDIWGGLAVLNKVFITIR